MPLDVDHILRKIAMPEQAMIALQRKENVDILYDLYRSAATKSFKLSLSEIFFD